MWVRIPDWMIVDEQAPKPSAGFVLRSIGVRVHGDVAPADSMTADGVVPDGSVNGRPTYRLTGVAGPATDVWEQYGRRRSSRRHVGVEFDLTVGELRFLVRGGGRSSAVPRNSRMTVAGSLQFVAAYEWDDFALTDTRADWLVTEVAEFPNRDLMADLSPV